MADSFSSSISTSGLLGISDLAEQYMQQQYAWGQQQFQQNSELTDKVVGDLMATYGQLSGLGNDMMNQYQTMFEPEYKSLVSDASNYASQARIQQAMGAAESGVAQDFSGQRNAALTDLQEFGVDPSSGRYSALDKSERVQQAAAEAGAGFQAEQATEATGRGLRSEALQLGSVMPSQATAAYNAAQGAATAGENTMLANSQEGVNMMGAPNTWGSVGQELRSSSSGSRSMGNNGEGVSGNTPSVNTSAYDAQQDALYGTIGQGSGSGGGQATVTDTSQSGDSGDSGGGGDSGDSEYAEGGAIPYSRSPSRGRVTDDVPAVINGRDPARLNAGEHVMTRAAVKMKGRKFFDNLNAKAKGGAIPTERTHV
jgi:hypothetical protein